MNSDASLEHIDIAATCLQHQFYSHHSFLAWLGFPRLEEVLDAVRHVRLDFAQAQKSRFYLRSHNFFWWIYWTAFLQGYDEYLRSATLDLRNTYIHYLGEYFMRLSMDPGRPTAGAEQLVAIVRPRFADFDRMRVWGAADTPPPEISPASLLATHPTVRQGRVLKFRERSETMCVRYFDGHHRLQIAALCGIRYLPCLVKQEELHQEQILGEVERLDFDGKRLLLQGWILHPEMPIEVVDIRVAHETTAQGHIRQRQDIAARFPHLPHAANSGFSIDVIFEYLSPDDHIVFEVVGLSDWIPVGKISGHHDPKSRLARRISGLFRGGS